MKTGTNVPEQIMNKMIARSSINSCIESLDKSGIYHDTLIELGIREMKGKDWKSHKDPKTKKIKSFSNDSVCVVTPETFTCNRKCKDCFVHLKTGEYVLCISIQETQIYGYELIVTNVEVKQSLYFEHHFSGKINRKNLIKFKPEDIDRPFAAVKHKNDDYSIFELINRHQ